jgi:hypothetical protein
MPRGVKTWNGEENLQIQSGRVRTVLRFHIMWPVIDTDFHELAGRVFERSATDAASVGTVVAAILDSKPGDRAIKIILDDLAAQRPSNWLLSAITDNNEALPTSYWIEFSNTVEIQNADSTTARRFFGRMARSIERSDAETAIAARFNNDAAVVQILAAWPEA